MNLRRVIVPIALLTLVLSSSPAAGQTKQSGDDPRFKASVATQKKINRFFHGVVVPKLKPCWGRVQGKGTIEIKYIYADNGKGGWAFKTSQVTKSNLPKGQEEAALACMQKAVAGTSFPRERSEKGASYRINWAWPVPFPPDADQQVARMWGSSGGEGGGCDGHGAAPKCVTCAGYPMSCVAVCVGGDPPCTMETSPYPGGFNKCTTGDDCASGGPFGLMGGMVIY